MCIRDSINTEIKVNGQKLETVTSFKYLGSVITDEGSKPEILLSLIHISEPTRLDYISDAVFFNSSIGDWLRTTVVRQGCSSATLFNIFLERITTDALEDHEGTVSIGGRTVLFN